MGHNDPVNWGGSIPFPSHAPFPETEKSGQARHQLPLVIHALRVDALKEVPLFPSSRSATADGHSRTLDEHLSSRLLSWPCLGATLGSVTYGICGEDSISILD